MGVETTLWPDLLKAILGNFGGIRWHVVKKVCQQYWPDGSIESKGSMNHSVLAYLIALWAALKAPSKCKDWTSFTKPEIIQWWKQELGDRLAKGLQLKEERSRIYAIWGAVVIAWHWDLFETFGDLRDLHRRFRESVLARSALVAVPWRMKRISGPDPVADKSVGWPSLYVPLAGARSFSGKSTDDDPEIEKAHHIGLSAWEMMLAEVYGDTWKPTGSQATQASELVSGLKPGRLGLSDDFLGKVERTWRNGDPDHVQELVGKLTPAWYWPCRLLRFERGSACVGTRRGSTISTAPIYTMAAHKDGTIHVLEVDPGNRHNINREPCGLSESTEDAIDYEFEAWAGGEDRPLVAYTFEPSRWGKLLWDVEIPRKGEAVIHWAADADEVEPPPLTPTVPLWPGHESEQWGEVEVAWQAVDGSTGYELTIAHERKLLPAGQTSYTLSVYEEGPVWWSPRATRGDEVGPGPVGGPYMFNAVEVPTAHPKPPGDPPASSKRDWTQIGIYLLVIAGIVYLATRGGCAT